LRGREDAARLSKVQHTANAGQQIRGEELLAAASNGLWLRVGLFDGANDLSQQPLLEQIIDFRARRLEGRPMAPSRQRADPRLRC
jgi:hypothetical protein